MATFGLTDEQENPTAVVDPMGGANQTRVRAYNERLVLSLVRRHGSGSKAEIARNTSASPCRGPITCSPTGSPSTVPIGTEALGLPEKLVR